MIKPIHKPGYSQLKKCGLGALLVAALALPASATAKEALTIAVLVEPKTKYSVKQISAGPSALETALIVGLIGPAGFGMVPADVQRSNDQYAKSLNHPENALPNLSGRFAAAALRELRARDRQIEAVPLPPDTVKWGQSLYKAIDADQTRYVLRLFPSAGYASMPSRVGTVSPFVATRYEFHDARKKKRLHKGEVRRFGDQHSDDILRAVENPDSLVDQMDGLAAAVMRDIYQQLVGADILHRVAKGTALADAYPSIRATLAHHAKRFTLQRPDSKVLYYKRSNDPYNFPAAPSRYQRQFGLVTRVDVLAAELGQDFDNLDEFVSLHLKRLAETGWPIDELRENSRLEVPDAWTSYVLPNLLGGESVFLHRKIQDFDLSHRVDLKDDNEAGRIEIVKKFEKIVGRYIRLTRLTID